MSGRFALLVAGLCGVVAAHIARDRNAGPWIVLVWTRISRIGVRVARLAAQARAGTVPPLRTSYELGKPRAPAKRPPLVLPRNSLWLVRTVQQTAVYGVHLRLLLDDPEMVALLAAAPQLHRVLRPLCRALGVTPPPRPQAPCPPRPASPDFKIPDPAPAEPAAPMAAKPDAPAAPRSRPRPASARTRRAGWPPGYTLKPA